MFPFCCLLKIFVYIYNMNVNKNQKVMKLKIEKHIITNEWLVIKDGMLLTIFPTKEDAEKFVRRIETQKRNN